MSVYLMTEAVVHDVEAYEKYKEQAPQYVHAMVENTVVEVGASMS